MATIDVTGQYVLTNSFTVTNKQMAADTSALTMDTYDGTSQSGQWFLTPADSPPFYRLHTVAAGSGQSLDVLNDAGTASIHLTMAATGQFTGQYWRLDTWASGASGYPYRLSNNFTGPDMHLDVYSDTLEPHLASGDYTGQHWALVRVAGDAAPAPSTTTSSVGAGGGAGGAATTTPPTSASSTVGVVASSSPAAAQSSSALSAGAIAGISVGGFAALALVIGAIAFFVLSAARGERNGGGGVPHGGQDLGQPQKDQWKQDPLTQNPNLGTVSPPPLYATHPQPNNMYAYSPGQVELGAGGPQALPTELPSPQRAELPAGPH